MSDKNEESANYRARLAEAKLQSLRNDIFGCLAMIDGHAEWLLLELNKSDCSEKTNELSECVHKIKANSEKIFQFVVDATE
jgi:hypothetical protein